jgi:hypothetical protein
MSWVEKIDYVMSSVVSTVTVFCSTTTQDVNLHLFSSLLVANDMALQLMRVASSTAAPRVLKLG